MRLLLIIIGGVILWGCTPTVKKVAIYRGKESVVVVKKGDFLLDERERVFIKREAERFGIEIPERKEVEKYLRWYLRDKRSLEEALRRANLYAPYIRKILEEYGLPEELSLLPLVESGFNPFAVSRSGAAGIWQLMPETAKRFGLRVDKRVDERFDLEKSTRAAARYLKELYDRFGSWELVLAAYNCGEGCVERRTKGENFWKAKRALPEQTRKYVPMFFASLLIAMSPQKYGLSVKLDNLFIEKKVTRRGYRLKDFIRSVNIKESTFKDLNPHIRGNYIPSGVHVYLPKRSERTVVRREINRSAKPLREAKRKIRKTARRPKLPEYAKGKERDGVFAPKLVIKSGDSVKVETLKTDTKVVRLENGALLYIKE